jgi:hypothetical protein
VAAAFNPAGPAPTTTSRRPLRPPDRGRIVAAAEREPPYLLVQVGPFDRGAVIAQPLEARGEAGGGAPAIASIPVKPTDLPVAARKARALASTLEFPAHDLIVHEPLGPAAGHRQHVAERLASCAARISLPQSWHSSRTRSARSKWRMASALA